MTDELPPRLVVGYWFCSICGAQVQTLSEAGWCPDVDCRRTPDCGGAMVQLPGKPLRWFV